VNDTRQVVLSKSLPYRGEFGAPRPPELNRLALPPGAMPSHLGGRPLKAWRYVGVFGPDLMLCIAAVRIGRARQSFWAVWDRAVGRLDERTAFSAAGVRLMPGRAEVTCSKVEIRLELEETAGVETVCASGDGYAWTRKQGGIRAHGTIALGGRPARRIDARALIDDTAAYYERHTSWRWCAGVGTRQDGRGLAWNLVAGVNDPPSHSERTVWVDGRPAEAPAVGFAADLSAVGELPFRSEGAGEVRFLGQAVGKLPFGAEPAGELRFGAEATREHRQNLLLVRSRYRQPFGTFSGTLPDGSQLESGYGVMEDHDAWW
jgi:hypothetical protein